MKLLRQLVVCCVETTSRRRWCKGAIDLLRRTVVVGLLFRAKARARLALVDWRRRPRASLSLLRASFWSDNPSS
jgi:hypothetical protein